MPQSMNASLLPFFRPKGVVVVGASTSPEKLGYGIARNLVASGYAGGIHFVGQRPGELFGLPLQTDLKQIPDPVDLAVLVVPSTSVPDTLDACASRGIHAVIVISAGFGESGPQGKLLEQRCIEIARARGIRLLGPNCIGIIDTHLPLDTSFLQPPMPPPGAIAFISHSGAFCAAIVDWSRQQAFGFSQIISLGNQADINETDVLPLVAEDAHTHVIALYLEGVSDGIRFVRAAREVTRRKPVLALKVGRFESGHRAVASHTGAMAVSDIAFDAAVARAGIIRADSAEQMFDWARALDACPLPEGRRVAVLTDAGGPGVIAVDALEMRGLHLAALADSTRASLAAGLPMAASVQNPVDMLASASPADYAACLNILLADTGVDAGLVILPPPPMFSAESVADALIPIIKGSPKPVVIALLGSRLTAAAFDRFSRAQIATYTFPERAASALAALAHRADFLRAPETALQRPFDAVTRPGMSIDELIGAYGIPAAPLRLAKSPDEAVARAQELRFPVVMKIASADILHKSDIGGVLLGVRNIPEVESGYAQLLQDVLRRAPNTSIEGINVQHQITVDQEVIVGATRDPSFGTLVMFGSGGVEAEGLRDVAFALAPLSTSEADALINRTWAGRRLDGFRNVRPVDRSAVRDILLRLSWLAFEHLEIAEIEINPLGVLPKGAIALDIRARVLPPSV